MCSLLNVNMPVFINSRIYSTSFIKISQFEIFIDVRPPLEHHLAVLTDLDDAEDEGLNDPP